MTTMKQMILGSAAALLAASTAQAADLPVKAKAVEYVKICSIYGAGFYYIPGTDTCIKIGGAIRLDTTFNGGPYDAPFWQGGAGGNNLWTKDNFLTRERINIDHRYAHGDRIRRGAYLSRTCSSTSRRTATASPAASREVDFAFIQFAGFTFGKAVSQLRSAMGADQALDLIGLPCGFEQYDRHSRRSPTRLEFGNGVSAPSRSRMRRPIAMPASTIPRTLHRRAGARVSSPVPSTAPISNTFFGNATGGNHIPDVVGNLRPRSEVGHAAFRCGHASRRRPASTGQMNPSGILTMSTALPSAAQWNSRTCRPVQATA